jgi:hypothetical protein
VFVSDLGHKFHCIKQQADPSSLAHGGAHGKFECRACGAVANTVVDGVDAHVRSSSLGFFAGTSALQPFSVNNQGNGTSSHKLPKPKQRQRQQTIPSALKVGARRDGRPRWPRRVVWNLGANTAHTTHHADDYDRGNGGGTEDDIARKQGEWQVSKLENNTVYQQWLVGSGALFTLQSAQACWDGLRLPRGRRFLLLPPAPAASSQKSVCHGSSLFSSN